MEKSCLTCINCSDYYENVNGEDILVRFCPIKNRQVNDDESCEDYE